MGQNRPSRKSERPGAGGVRGSCVIGGAGKVRKDSWLLEEDLPGKGGGISCAGTTCAKVSGGRRG